LASLAQKSFGRGGFEWNLFVTITTSQLIAAAFLKACQDHMLAQQNGQVEQRQHFLQAAMALENAYPDVVARVRSASQRTRRLS
jgi:hypothetical protein